MRICYWGNCCKQWHRANKHFFLKKKKKSKWPQCTTVKSNLVYQKCTQVQLLQVTAPKGVTLTSVCQMALTVASPYLARWPLWLYWECVYLCACDCICLNECVMCVRLYKCDTEKSVYPCQSVQSPGHLVPSVRVLLFSFPRSRPRITVCRRPDFHCQGQVTAAPIPAWG